MTQSPNEILARMMGIANVFCPFCNSPADMSDHKKIEATCALGCHCKFDYKAAVAPDFANDANWAERLAVWLAERDGIKGVSYSWHIEQLMVTTFSDDGSDFRFFNGDFKTAICAAGLWYNEQRGAAK